MNKWRHRVAWLILGAAVALAGCGGEVTPGPSGEGMEPTSSAAPSEVESPKALPRTVTTYRDAWGVPHLFAETLADAAYGLGYAQAEDRLADIYINARTATGRMAEAFGPEHVERDYLIRLVRNAEVVQEYWATCPEHLKSLGENFVKGVQAYLADHPEKQIEFAMELEGWHCGAIARAMILQWPIGTIFDDLSHKEAAPSFSSNAWVVAPSRSAEGCAILLTDPHLTWEGMAVFYEARVHTQQADLSGFFLVGCPLLALGHNGYVAWACTTGGPDTSDVYAIKLNPDNLTQYEYDGAWLQAELTTITIPIRGSQPVEKSAAYTHLGPVMSEPDLEKHIAYVGASPYLEQTGLFEQLYRMNTARSCTEFYNALAMQCLMEQNILFADREGTIQYVRNGATPKRPEGYDWSKPVPGNTQATAWLGIHDIADLVQITNPEHGYMQNCNVSPQFMTRERLIDLGAYPDYVLNVSWDTQNPRSQRVIQLLDTDELITKDEAMAIAFDVYDILAKPWQEALKSALDSDTTGLAEDAAFARAVNTLLTWDGRYVPESVGAPLMKFWRLNCQKAGIDCEAIIQERMLSPAERAHLLELLAKTLEELRGRSGSAEITWGALHKVGRGERLFPAAGAEFGNSAAFTETVFDVESKETAEGIFVAHSGSMATQLIFLYKHGIESYTCTMWGQSADPQSPHYVDQGEKLYSKRTFKPAWFDKEELMDHVESQKVLTIP